VSSMGFLTRDGEARISGREYAKLECLVRDLAWNQVEQHFDLSESRAPSALRDVVSWPEHVLNTSGVGYQSFASTARLWMNTGSYPVHTPTAREVATTFETRINTVAADPSDPIALAARFAGQAQVNGWIDGPDRAWLSDVIEQGMNQPYPEHLIGGRDDQVLRGPLFSDAPHRKSHYDGWAAAAEMLRADDKGIVVLDYSVTDGFPDPQWAGWPTALDDPDERQEAWDAWADVTAEQRWDDSERGLRAATEQSPSRRITPANLHTPGFGTTEGHTWVSLAEAWGVHDQVTPIRTYLT
jgi:hypothetical protein